MRMDGKEAHWKFLIWQEYEQRLYGNRILENLVSYKLIELNNLPHFQMLKDSQQALYAPWLFLNFNIYVNVYFYCYSS